MWYCGMVCLNSSPSPLTLCILLRVMSLFCGYLVTLLEYLMNGKIFGMYILYKFMVVIIACIYSNPLLNLICSFLRLCSILTMGRTKHLRVHQQLVAPPRSGNVQIGKDIPDSRDPHMSIPLPKRKKL